MNPAETKDRLFRNPPGPVLKGALLGILASVLVAGCGRDPSPAEAGPAESSPPAADLVLLGGKIATMDSERTIADSLAIGGYRIQAVGDRDEIEALVGPETRVIELDGHFVMPGFIEGHGHFMYLGRAMQVLDLRDARSWDEIVGKVARAAETAPPGAWIFGTGWHQEKWDETPFGSVDGVPSNDGLSAVSPDHPVQLQHASGHAAYYNDHALALAGIDRETADPPGGTIVRDARGDATGLMRETAQGLLTPLIEQYEAALPDSERERVGRERVRLASETALRNGVTSFQDAGSSFETIDFLRRLEAEGALPVRLYVMVGSETNESMAERLPDYRMVSEGNDYLTVRAIKRMIDGALGAHGAWMLEPYADKPDTVGLVVETVESIERTGDLAIQHGFQVNTHAIGDRANRETLDLYQRAWRRAGVQDGAGLRWRIEHVQHTDPTDVPRFAGLGVIASVQTVHATSDGPWTYARLGVERAERITHLWRDLIDSGATVMNGTDVPVELIDPIANIHAAITRQMNNGQSFVAGQVMTREEALASYTINAAYGAFEEDVKGSLEPGKYADIVVLSQDLLTVPEDAIRDTRVEMTIVGGRVRSF
ncbi:amidohydrolase [Elongatibacter sediminis]|uniref:Amidohydrolase n=1 Tax=Elongatibacter sediminis TaxID=3119006 RepID=A0AAW9R8G0_9GAMM